MHAHKNSEVEECIKRIPNLFYLKIMVVTFVYIYILSDFISILKYNYFILTTLHVSYFENFCEHIFTSIYFAPVFLWLYSSLLYGCIKI